MFFKWKIQANVWRLEMPGNQGWRRTARPTIQQKPLKLISPSASLLHPFQTVMYGLSVAKYPCRFFFCGAEVACLVWSVFFVCDSDGTDQQPATANSSNRTPIFLTRGSPISAQVSFPATQVPPMQLVVRQ